MRLVILFVMVMIAGCAVNGTGVPAGKYAGDYEPVAVERMGSPAMLESFNESVCHTEQVLLCRGEARDGDCRCAMIYDVERRLGPVTPDVQGFRNSKQR